MTPFRACEEGACEVDGLVVNAPIFLDYLSLLVAAVAVAVTTTVTAVSKGAAHCCSAAAVAAEQ